MSTPSPQEAFLARIREHQGVLSRLAGAYASNPDDRRDLQQEMLVQLWRAFASYRGDARFSTWMYRVALNTALMGKRALSRRAEGRLSGTNEDVDALPGPKHEPDEVRMLYAAVRTLPAIDRAIVALWLEGHTYPEIADVTGLGRSNVSVRLVRAKDRLRAALQEPRPQEEATR